MRYHQIYEKLISNLINNYKFAIIKVTKKKIRKESLSRHRRNRRWSHVRSRVAVGPFPTPTTSPPPQPSLISTPPRQVPSSLSCKP
ncbi:unnamed protein product [Brassica oleracea]